MSATKDTHPISHPGEDAVSADAANSGKKAVHVKWAGKTIALGTFSALEADEKCARAKALTRAWRSTIRPKPTREWVMLELERLGVRVVSGRLGRKAGDDGDEVAAPINGTPNLVQAPGIGGIDPLAGRAVGLGVDSGLAGLMHTAARRNSSIGLSMLKEGRRGSLELLGQLFGGCDPTDLRIPPHRPYTGGGPAAAYEAAFHDHYLRKSEEQQRRASSLGLGSLSGGGMGNIGSSVNPDQHYEMLKLHHMNLLNEIQETTLMMNLYQQQQLQQHLQQQANVEELSSDRPETSLTFQHQKQNQGSITNCNDFQQMKSNSQLMQQRASLGLGSTQFGFGGGINAQQLQLKQQLILNNQINQLNSGASSSGAQDTTNDGTTNQDSQVISSKRSFGNEERAQSKRQKNDFGGHATRGDTEESNEDRQTSA